MEEILPKQDETIAAKRINRLSKKFAEVRHKGFLDNAWWRNDIVEFSGIALIMSLNFYLILPLFSREVDSGSLFSGPVIPYISRLVSSIAQVPIPYAIHLTYVFIFLFFPLSFFILIQLLTGRRLVAIISMLFATLPVFIFAKIRIIGGFLGSDGPHIASLSFMPMAVYSLISFLRKGGVKNLLVVSISSAMILLISPFGFLAYFIFAVLATFSEMLLGQGRLKISRFVGVFIITFGLASFWYNPAFIVWMVLGPVGAETRTIIINFIPISFFVLPIVGTFGYLLFDRKTNLQPVFLACFWTITFLLIILMGKRNFIALGPVRYLPELGISVAFLLGIGVVSLIDFLKSPKFKIIPWLNKPALSNPLITLALILLVIAIIALKSNLDIETKEAANSGNNIEKSRLWAVKDSFNGSASLIGYAVTILTVTTLAFFAIMVRKGKKNSYQAIRQLSHETKK
ncbi:MAG: hypothetical protein Q8P10_01495 [bacterium]|nr:hypothetical protein [bacterium]